MRPRTFYAESGDVKIAYQVMGDGKLDLVFVPGFISHLEYALENPAYARVFDRLSSFARLIRFDKRGTGLSDRNIEFSTLEQHLDDLQAVMDAVGSKRAALLGMSEGGCMAALFAATYPERTSALILYGCFAKGLWSEDYPWAATEAEYDKSIAAIEDDWGTAMDLRYMAPSAAQDPEVREWLASYLRYSATPRDAIRIVKWNADLDVRDILSSIHTPTLVIHRRDDLFVKFDEGRYLAEHIPKAKLVELPGEDHLMWPGDQDSILNEIEEFLTGVRPVPEPERVLLTVLFTDIVESTSKAAELGDHRWKDLLQSHDKIVRECLEPYRGKEINTTGDGFISTFDGPTRAIQCAIAIRDQIASTGLQLRFGMHTGECERRGDDLSGIAVHIASRVLERSQPDEILVSSTVKDLVVGSKIEFDDRGDEPLKGSPGRWHLFAVKSY